MPTLETSTADYLRLTNQADDPATPAANFGAYYFKGGVPYAKNDAGTEVSLVPAGSDTSGWNAAASAWSYASADAPTFVITTASDERGSIGVGMKIKLTQTTPKYFIVTAITSSTITVYGGTDYTLANAAITSPYFSTHKAPLGFPADPAKWSVLVTDTSNRTQATPTQNQWYNNGSITISLPIGAWSVDYQAILQLADASSTAWNVYSTLSTANNTESDISMTARVSGSATINTASTVSRNKFITVAAKTSYYLNERTDNLNLDNMYIRGDQGTTIIRAVCAYL